MNALPLDIIIIIIIIIIIKMIISTKNNPLLITKLAKKSYLQLISLKKTIQSKHYLHDSSD